jgi:hypothetical protein
VIAADAFEHPAFAHALVAEFRAESSSCHKRHHDSLNRHDCFALLFEHVPPGIDARHAFVVMFRSALTKAMGRRAACAIVAPSAEIMGA